MTKEADIKKIELRVSVNCCHGCERKVKKALLSVEGVLKTEIDPSQPKVTVIGNVDPKTLIKRLQKAGKQAELWSNGNQSSAKEKKEVDMQFCSNGNQSPAKEMKEVDMPVTNEKTRHECEKPKSSDSSSNTTDKSKESKNGENESGDIAAKKEEKLKESAANSPIPEAIKNENPVPPQPEMKAFPEASDIRTQAQYCYMVEPYAITVPYYVIPSYATHPLLPTCCSQPHCCHERPVFQPPYQTPVTQVGDYFSDENTLGCSVM